YKIMLDEPALPDFDELVSSIAAAHQSGRCVAFHSVTRTEIHFALATLEAAGVAPGDRLEHASVTPPEAFDLARRLGLTIVTQPNFIAERGDAYHENVESRDLTYLYRVRSWLEAGVSLAAGTDAPFGDPDPWLAMRAAVLRETRTGRCMGEGERVSPESALALFSNGFTHKIASNLDARGVAVGQRADLCLLKEPWSKARRTLSSELVAATICDGRLLWNAIA
ncbi:MAG: amidohydrolase family protein, partial [Proteobacteria bacterium]|nr:amidohydrolase family protein [Pseudomonadota bacterium]